jgi:hypothetical protein
MTIVARVMMKIPLVLAGLFFGTLLGMLFWYYQKSTSAEDGALDLLDRLADSEAHVRRLEAQLREQRVDESQVS